jgi:tight adherence protein C
MSLDPLGLLGSLAAGAAIAAAVIWVLRTLATEDLQQKDEWRYDVSRINELRRVDWAYRIFQRLIQFLARLNRGAFRNQLAEVQREIQAAGLSRFWLPEEYLAKTQLVAISLLPIFLYLSISWMGAPGVIMALLLVGLTAWLLRRRLSRLAQRRLQAIKRRMPFLLDLLTLLMEAGASFQGALKQAVLEFEGHPVSIEFGRVLTDMRMGKARTEAFDNLRRRLSDDEIGGIVGSIIQSEELGTPLADIFRTQADVLRVKRSQRAETIAGEAAVSMLLPGILVMMATVLIRLGPFMLNFLAVGIGF